MFGWLTNRPKRGGIFSEYADSLQAASQLAPIPEPKVKPKQSAFPSYLTTATPSPDSPLPRTDRSLINTDIESYRGGTDSRKIVRDFASSTPDLSAAVFAYIRTAISPTYTAMARNPDGTFNREATAVLQQILTRFDVVQDYSDGFSGIASLRSTSESLVKEAMYYGAMGLELVLDKVRMPRQLVPVSVSQIQFKPDKSLKWLRPVQLLSGTEVDLDIATFFYVALDQDLLDPYATSPLEPALQPVLFSAAFMNDLRRVVRRAVHPRIGVKIDEEKFRKFIPEKVKHDQTKLDAYMAQVISDIENRINGLRPEDALVYFDMLGVEYINNGNISLSKEYEVLQGLMDAKMTTGAKALPSILGHGSGSQNIASSETLLFMKNAAGIQAKLNEIYSRSLTLSIRLMGFDCYVEFRYAPIDLRPEGELEAYRSMYQSRILEQLSLGFIVDDEASINLTGQLTPPGFKPLSGTGFRAPAGGDAALNGNPASSTGAKGNPKGDANAQANEPKTPKQAKGPAKKAGTPDAELLEESVETPTLTREDVIAAVREAMPPPAVVGELVAMESGPTLAEVEQAMAGAIDTLRAEIERREREVEAERAEPNPEEGEFLRAQLAELSGNLKALTDRVLEQAPPKAAEPQVLNLTIVNEGSTRQATVKVGELLRDGTGKATGIRISEEPAAIQE